MLREIAPHAAGDRLRQRQQFETVSSQDDAAGMPGIERRTDRVGTMARFTSALVAFVLVMMAVSAVLGVVLARVIGVDLMTGYLATTPGGINAVTVTSMSAGTDTTLVVAV